MLRGLMGALPGMALGILPGDRIAPHLPDRTMLKGIYLDVYGHWMEETDRSAS